MTQAEQRELLTEFTAWLAVQEDVVGPASADPRRWRDDGVGEELVERFLGERGGALGYTDDELKGTARDNGRRTLLVAGEPLTHARAIELGVDPVGLPAEADVYRDVPEQIAAEMAELLRRAGVEGVEVVQDA